MPTSRKDESSAVCPSTLTALQENRTFQDYVFNDSASNLDTAHLWIFCLETNHRKSGMRLKCMPEMKTITDTLKRRIKQLSRTGGQCCCCFRNSHHRSPQNNAWSKITLYTPTSQVMPEVVGKCTAAKLPSNFIDRSNEWFSEIIWSCTWSTCLFSWKKNQCRTGFIN